ncbi:hypothetical protein EDD11_003937 [Mortierella claussenii]|nr:hypothetical protein EDD11_003937 [Mortierella claussenii]
MRSSATCRRRMTVGFVYCLAAAASLLMAYPTLTQTGHDRFMVAAAPTASSFRKRQDLVPAPVMMDDPCTTLANTTEPDITVSLVRQCYDNIPYNATLASNVLSTLYTLFRDYYIFVDTAMIENHEKPFNTPAVDILTGLDELARKEYKHDYEFHADVDLLVSSLNDAHANYIAYCYRHYLYIQPFELYAPVIDNIQTVRILQDNSNNGFEDCQVVTIDGVDALDAIQDWVDVHSAVSKDRGVRLNKALSAMNFNTETNQWTLLSGLFTTRASLPERQTMVYYIKCPATTAFPEGQEHHVNADWEVYRLRSWNEFNSTESFLTQNCYEDTDPKTEQTTSKHRRRKRGVDATERSPQGGDADSLRAKRLYTSQDSIQAAIEQPVHHDTIVPLRHPIQKRQDDAVTNPVATMIYNGTSTAFYQLVQRPEIGVVVIPTHSVNLQTETDIMEQGFGQLYNAGVRNVILDLTANGGGYVSFAYDLVDWMFPMDNQTSVYQSDLRASMSAKALAQADLADEEYVSYFNPGSFSDPTTGNDFETNFFLQDRTLRRGHRRVDYTKQVLMNHNLGAFEMDMPWQHGADRIVVLTDGNCGSACGMSLNRLKNTHGVKSYASGGRMGEELSLFSFPGASVYALDAILTDFENLKVDKPMERMRYKGIFRVPILEFYLENDSVPIEYNPKLFKADFHLDYTPITARHHEVMWEIVANNHWKQEGQTGDHPSIEKHRR